MSDLSEQIKITDDLEALLSVLPPYIKEALEAANDGEKLIEIVMDLGRQPEARYTDREVILSEREITQDDIDYVTERIGKFMGDNRAGIERTLHRISAILNRQGKVIGLTSRVGRAVFGTVDVVQDILESGQSLLLLGRPGVGKTTLLREAARVLAETKRVIIVDTSNEIAGDGDIPHPAIGRARRMQVARPSLQHEVMIEAVENHMPEVIIIDEIGRQLEAEAARTIAERGVQLVGTAHGQTLENLLLNPTLSDLVGGIDSVTLSDEEARRRGTQKTVLERRAPPTFDVLVEIQDRQTFAVHHDVARAVDSLLRQKPLLPEIRYRDEAGEVKIETPAQPAAAPARDRDRDTREVMPVAKGKNGDYGDFRGKMAASGMLDFESTKSMQPIKIFPYGIGQNRLRQAARTLRVPVTLVDDLDDADILMTLKSYYRKHPQPITEAERLGKPVYVLRSNTVIQMESCLADIFSLSERESDPASIAMRETQEAIRKILSGTRSVELSPQSAHIRREQHELARQAKLVSHSLGREPYRRVRIYRDAPTGSK
ncbi:MAG: single-stranded DNA-binding protein [Chloroflexota bacterium]|nr:MAG: single-stranded DNA-binding protein [Chloroflexota bacterium]